MSTNEPDTGTSKSRKGRLDHRAKSSLALGVIEVQSIDIDIFSHKAFNPTGWELTVDLRYLQGGPRLPLAPVLSRNGACRFQLVGVACHP